jgi:hypothetical protein
LNRIGWSVGLSPSISRPAFVTIAHAFGKHYLQSHSFAVWSVIVGSIRG